MQLAKWLCGQKRVLIEVNLANNVTIVIRTMPIMSQEPANCEGDDSRYGH